jgi:hypothetical protein
MHRLVAGLIVLTGIVSVPNVGRADTLPAPRPVPGVPPVPGVVVAPVMPAPPVYYRRSAYEVWQYYGIDQQGYFKPLVIYLPGNHAFGAYSGKPFPWASAYPQEFTRGVLGTPYRSNPTPYFPD